MFKTKKKITKQNSKKICFESELKILQPRLLGFILSIITNKADAMDVLQETNVISFKRQDCYDSSKGEFKNWVFAIARFQIMGFLTKSKRNRLSFNSEMVENIMNEAQEINENDIKLESKILNSCYKDLPDHMSLMANLWFKQEKSMKEISKITGRSIGAVSGTMFRIRSNLTKCAKRKMNKYEVYGNYED